MRRKISSLSNTTFSSNVFKAGLVLPVLVLSGFLLTVSCAARADSGSGILETIGVSTAVGTVLGASTLPFYAEPGKHLMNFAYGASVGAVVGVGILVYMLFQGSRDEYGDEYSYLRKRNESLAALDVRRIASLPVTQASIFVPVVSLNW